MPGIFMYTETKKQLVIDEGRKNRLYKCTANKLTIGIGYNIEDNGLPDHIIDQLFEESFDIALGDAVSFVGDPGIWELLDEARQGVIINMAFNMGLPTLREFKRFRKAILRGDFDQASVEMLESMWAYQVPERAERLAEIMAYGADE